MATGEGNTLKRPKYIRWLFFQQTYNRLLCYQHGEQGEFIFLFHDREEMLKWVDVLMTDQFKEDSVRPTSRSDNGKKAMFDKGCSIAEVMSRVSRLQIVVIRHAYQIVSQSEQRRRPEPVPNSLQDIPMIEIASDLSDEIMIWSSAYPSTTAHDALEENFSKRYHRDILHDWAAYCFGINPVFNPRTFTRGAHSPHARPHLDPTTLLHTSSENNTDKCICCHTSLYAGGSHEAFCPMNSLVREFIGDDPVLHDLAREIFVVPTLPHETRQLLSSPDRKTRSFNVLSQLLALTEMNIHASSHWTHERQTQILRVCFDLTKNIMLPEDRV